MAVIFDIGFNKGQFTAVCNRLYPEHRIIGVEANIALCYEANKSSFRNLTLLNKLVSNKDKSVEKLHIDLVQDGISTASTEFMTESRFSKGSKYLEENNSDWSHTIEVPTITLDTMIESYGTPEILKIDIEGYEYEALCGLSRKVGKICFECHEEESAKLDKCIQHLTELGYTEFGFIGYLDEETVYENLTHSAQGDPYLIEPEKYVSWDKLRADLDKAFQPQRRVNYGMFWSK